MKLCCVNTACKVAIVVLQQVELRCDVKSPIIVVILAIPLFCCSVATVHY